MQYSAIYDPRASATPSQAAAADRRAARLRRIGSHARPDTPIMLRRALPPVVVEIQTKPAVVPADPDALFALWVERQRQKHSEAIKQFEERAESEVKRASVELIQKVVANHYGADWRIMMSATRTKDVVRPRQIAMYLAKTMSARSLPEVGRRFGGRDHTTILHAVRKITALIEIDDHLASEIEIIKSLIEARVS